MLKTAMSVNEAQQASILVFRALPQETITNLINSNDLPPDKQIIAFREEFHQIRNALICPSCQQVAVLRSKGVSKEKYYYLICGNCKKSLPYASVKESLLKRGLEDQRKEVNDLQRAITSPKAHNDEDDDAEIEELNFKRKKLNSMTKELLRSPNSSHLLDDVNHRPKPTLELSFSEDDASTTSNSYHEKPKIDETILKEIKETIKNEIYDELDHILNEKNNEIKKLKQRIYELENNRKQVNIDETKEQEPTPWNIVARKNGNGKYEKTSTSSSKIKTSNKFDVLMKVDPVTKQPVKRTVDECLDFLAGIGRPEPTKLTTIIAEGMKAGSVGDARKLINEATKIPKRDIFNIAFPGQYTAIITVNSKHADTLTQMLNRKGGISFKKDDGFSPAIMKDVKLSDSERKLKSAEIYKKIIIKDLERTYIPKPLRRFWGIELNRINQILKPAVEKDEDVTLGKESLTGTDSGSSSEF